MTPRIPALLFAGALVIAGCSGGDDESASTTDAAPETTATPTTSAPAPATDAPSTTAPDDTTAPAGEFADWCAVAIEVETLSSQSDLVDYTDPAAVEEYLDQLIPALEASVDSAPAEIADAVATSADISGRFRDALADAGYDMLVADLSLVDELDAERDAARDEIRAFNAEYCGFEFDDDVDPDEPDDDFSFSDGSLRDQFIGQLVASGFTMPEAACIFDEMDFSDPSSLEDPDALIPIFEFCGIDLDRLEEIGTAVAPDLAVGDDLLATSLASIGLDDDQIECVTAEIEALPPGDVDEDLVLATMLGCGVSMEQITSPDLSSAGELEDLYVEQFMAMGVDEEGAQCLYDELLVGNIEGFTAEDVLGAMELCGIDPLTLN
ncbi:MAG: hypothetical protein RIB65_04440 [Ilumatobacter fluminis]|uniref:hypothetical protein n=1 Tax=Ilumatobacter fluminis TaxID=467091 RepID=UPI0032EE634A